MSRRSTGGATTSVVVALYEGFDELDAVGPYEVFANAAADRPLEVSLRTVGTAETVTASHGLRVEPDGAGLGAPDLLVVPGGGWTDGSETGARAEVRDGRLPERVRELHARGTRIASVCTGAMILASAGVLDGRRATTHRGARDDLRARGVEVRDDRIVDEGDVVTAGGVTAGLDLACYLVADRWGEDAARDVAAAMEYDPRY